MKSMAPRVGRPLSAAAPPFLSADAPEFTPAPPVVAIDCEMVLGPERKSVLAHVAIVDFYGQQKYNEYVIPPGGINSITDYLTEFSGITKNLLRSEKNGGEALPFETVKTEVHDILNGRVIVGHGLINDFKVLEYDPTYNTVWDTAVIDEHLREPEYPGARRKAKKLKELAAEVGNNIQKNVINANGKPLKKGHSPLEDARASMNLYRISQGFPKIVYDDMAVA